jgi:hypothetical protein
MSLLIINIYCKTKTAKKKKDEVARVLAVFINGDSTDANFDILWRVVKDSIRVDTNDVTKNHVYVDSSYYREMLDTVRIANGQPLRDSTGKVTLRPIFVFIPKKNVWDSYISVDSARKRFDPFIKKKDSMIKR